jgi:hypothetical protein
MSRDGPSCFPCLCKTGFTACEETKIFVIPRRVARRGISLFLRLKQREIPHFVRNNKMEYFFRNLFSLSAFSLNKIKIRQAEACPTSTNPPPASWLPSLGIRLAATVAVRPH